VWKTSDLSSAGLEGPNTNHVHFNVLLQPDQNTSFNDLMNKLSGIDVSFSKAPSKKDDGEHDDFNTSPF
jgi:hypothetical protein